MKSLELLQRHYSRSDVVEELCYFCRNRWIAVHCISPSQGLVFRRYGRGYTPLKLSSPSDFKHLLQALGKCRLRSIYASVTIYKRLSRLEDVYDYSLFSRSTPTWDIDGIFSNWRETISIAREIVSFLEQHGVTSVYVKWSGNGCHVHIHEGAFSEELLRKRNPLDLAYAIVEYVRLKLESRFVELSPGGDTVVENKIDPARVFTAPLSLHRELDVVCICMKPNQLDDFTPDWVKPHSFKHSSDWKHCVEGEADELAEIAYEAVGGYPLRTRIRRRKHPPLDEQIRKWLEKA